MAVSFSIDPTGTARDFTSSVLVWSDSSAFPVTAVATGTLVLLVTCRAWDAGASRTMTATWNGVNVPVKATSLLGTITGQDDFHYWVGALNSPDMTDDALSVTVAEGVMRGIRAQAFFCNGVDSTVPVVVHDFRDRDAIGNSVMLSATPARAGSMLVSANGLVAAATSTITAFSPSGWATVFQGGATAGAKHTLAIRYSAAASTAAVSTTTQWADSKVARGGVLFEIQTATGGGGGSDVSESVAAADTIGAPVVAVTAGLTESVSPAEVRSAEVPSNTSPENPPGVWTGAAASWLPFTGVDSKGLNSLTVSGMAAATIKGPGATFAAGSSFNAQIDGLYIRAPGANGPRTGARPIPTELAPYPPPNTGNNPNTLCANPVRALADKIYDFRDCVGIVHEERTIPPAYDGYQYSMWESTAAGTNSVICGGKSHTLNAAWLNGAWAAIHGTDDNNNDVPGFNAPGIWITAAGNGAKWQGFYLKGQLDGIQPRADGWLIENACITARDDVFENDDQYSGTIRGAYLQGHDLLSVRPGDGSRTEANQHCLVKFEKCVIRMKRQPYDGDEKWHAGQFTAPGASAGDSASWMKNPYDPDDPNRHDTLSAAQTRTADWLACKSCFKSGTYGAASQHLYFARVHMVDCIILFESMAIEGADQTFFPGEGDGSVVPGGTRTGSKYENVTVCVVAPGGWNAISSVQTASELATMGITVINPNGSNEATAWNTFKAAEDDFFAAHGYDEDTDTFSWNRTTATSAPAPTTDFVEVYPMEVEDPANASKIVGAGRSFARKVAPKIGSPTSAAVEFWCKPTAVGQIFYLGPQSTGPVDFYTPSPDNATFQESASGNYDVDVLANDDASGPKTLLSVTANPPLPAGSVSRASNMLRIAKAGIGTGTYTIDYVGALASNTAVSGGGRVTLTVTPAVVVPFYTAVDDRTGSAVGAGTVDINVLDNDDASGAKELVSVTAVSPELGGGKVRILSQKVNITKTGLLSGDYLVDYVGALASDHSVNDTGRVTLTLKSTSVGDPFGVLHFYPMAIDNPGGMNIIRPSGFQTNGENNFNCDQPNTIYDLRGYFATPHINAASGTPFNIKGLRSSSVACGGRSKSTNHDYWGDESGAPWSQIHGNDSTGGGASGNYASLGIYNAQPGARLQGFYCKHTMDTILPHDEGSGVDGVIIENSCFVDCRDDLQDDSQQKIVLRNVLHHAHVAATSWRPGADSAHPGKSGKIQYWENCLIEGQRMKYQAEANKSAKLGGLRQGIYKGPGNTGNGIIANLRGVGFGCKWIFKTGDTNDPGGMKLRLSMRNCLILITSWPCRANGDESAQFPEIADGVGPGSRYGSYYENVHVLWVGPGQTSTNFVPWPFAQSKAHLASMGITVHDSSESDNWDNWVKTKNAWLDMNGYDEASDTFSWNRR